MNQTAIAKVEDSLVSNLIIRGDLSALNPEQKSIYYKQLCDRIGLDAFHQPFRIIKFRDGRESLYCTREGAQQLNRLHKVSHRIVAREIVNGAYVVTAQAFLPDSRQTESIGAVYLEGLKGDLYCNALMKAETKAKRRSTLDLLGLGLLDETETETVSGATSQSVDLKVIEPKEELKPEPLKEEQPKTEESKKETAKVVDLTTGKRVTAKKQLERAYELLQESCFTEDERQKGSSYLQKVVKDKDAITKMVNRLLELINERKPVSSPPVAPPDPDPADLVYEDDIPY